MPEYEPHVKRNFFFQVFFLTKPVKNNNNAVQNLIKKLL
jgi:hypothetical protein